MRTVSAGSRWAAVLALAACCCAGPEVAPAGEKSSAVREGADERQGDGVEELVVEVVAVRPHDPGAFTQGLVFDGRHLLESTGRFGRSELRRVDPESGEVLSRVALSPDHFGEGLALVSGAATGTGEEVGGGARLVQLTWLAGRALTWSAESFEPGETLTFEGEGWGLCFDGTSLVMSDGSATLTLRDVATFGPVRRVPVTLRGQPVRGLNELECIGGAVWANVLGSAVIVRIDPGSGAVTAVVDAGGLLSAEEAARADVLNGIAWDPEREIFYITGKNWPKLFEARFVPRPPGRGSLLEEER